MRSETHWRYPCSSLSPTIGCKGGEVAKATQSAVLWSDVLIPSSSPRELPLRFQISSLHLLPGLSPSPEFLYQVCHSTYPNGFTFLPVPWSLCSPSLFPPLHIFSTPAPLSPSALLNLAVPSHPSFLYPHQYCLTSLEKVDYVFIINTYLSICSLVSSFPPISPTQAFNCRPLLIFL